MYVELQNQFKSFHIYKFQIQNYYKEQFWT